MAQIRTSMAFYYEPLGPIAQLVEHCADNAGVTGSIPVGPTKRCGAVAQLGEHLLCKQGVRGSIPLSSTRSFNMNYSVAEAFFKGSVLCQYNR